MRIAVHGTSPSVTVVRNFLQMADYQLTGTPHFTIQLENGNSDAVIIDGVKSELETNVLNSIAEILHRPITLDRPGPTQKDNMLRIVFSQEHAEEVEKGVFRGILKTTGHGKPAPEVKTGWRKWFALLLLVPLLSHGQVPALQRVPVKQVVSASEVSASPAPLAGSVALQLRDLQYRKDKLLLQIVQLEKQSQALDDQILYIVDRVDREEKVDTSAFVLDLDTLQFVPRSHPQIMSIPVPSSSK